MTECQMTDYDAVLAGAEPAALSITVRLKLNLAVWLIDKTSFGDQHISSCAEIEPYPPDTPLPSWRDNLTPTWGFCKNSDIKVPYEMINEKPPESGSGPNDRNLSLDPCKSTLRLPMLTPN